ncbi:MAG: ABC transporter substrate-binding protein [Chlorobiales bacterium]|jgi:iron complex transport system substrate-binding protein|nr:ABC transporter substrate-binding protein [Chlorobiales bacterium]
MNRHHKKYVRPVYLFVLPLLLILLASCSNAGKKPLPAAREVTDMAGRKMVVPDTIRRVYVTRPGSVLMYAVAPDMVVSRSLWTTDVSKKFMLDTYLQLPYTEGSNEEIVKLKPDVIISYFNINPKTKDESDKLSEKVGIPVFMVDMNMEKYEDVFQVLGELLNCNAQTSRMMAFMHTYYDSIAIKAKQIPDEKKVRVYYAEGERGLNTDPSGSFHSQVLDMVGAINVAQVDVLPGKGMSAVSMEQVLLWNPDVILVWTGMGTAMTTWQYVNSDKLWAKASAVKNKHVYQISYQPFGWFDRPPGTNRIMGAIWTAQLLYPDVYQFNLENITREYFEIFYHHKLTDAELQEVLHPDPEGLNGTSEPNVSMPNKH